MGRTDAMEMTLTELYSRKAALKRRRWEWIKMMVDGIQGLSSDIERIEQEIDKRKRAMLPGVIQQGQTVNGNAGSHLGTIPTHPLKR